MKHVLTFSLFLYGLLLFGQPNTDVYIADIETIDSTRTLTNLLNISKNKGYDNQPAFFKENQLLFTSTRNGQTDIALKVIGLDETVWVTDTKIGSEYSPTPIPGQNAISSIRLDTTGLQRLYKYELTTGKAQKLLANAKVGYHLWYTNELLVATILVQNRMDLVLANIKDNSLDTLQKNVGRSLHKIPNSDLVSFVANVDGKLFLNSIHPISKEKLKIIELTNKSQDVCWLNDGTLLSGYDNMVVKYNPEKDMNWVGIANFKEQQIANISRLAVNNENTKLALVAEESPELIVQRQVDSFNARDLEAFVDCYSENMAAYNFPQDTLYSGKDKMRESYRRFYANTPAIKVEVKSRIVVGSTVLDEEIVTIGERTNRQLAIYQIEGGNIQTMTFIHDKKNVENPEKIVQEQLDAYNSRNIDDFSNTFSTDIIANSYPQKLRFKGIETLRESYRAFFESTPDLHCTINKRIVIGNFVIDEELVTMNGNKLHAVAIYEIDSGKISKVTFIR